MNRVLYLAFLLSISPAVALAGHWEFDASGLAGAYYGISETKDVGSVDNLANRWVTRADASFKSDYVFRKNTGWGFVQIQPSSSRLMIAAAAMANGVFSLSHG